MVSKLWIFFRIFVAYNLSVKSTKTFLNFFNVSFFGQKINILSLTIVKIMLDIIKLLWYLLRIAAFEYYLRLTGYFYPLYQSAFANVKDIYIEVNSYFGLLKKDLYSENKVLILKSFQEGLFKLIILVYYNLNNIL